MARLPMGSAVHFRERARSKRAVRGVDSGVVLIAEGDHVLVEKAYGKADFFFRYEYAKVKFVRDGKGSIFKDDLAMARRRAVGVCSEIVISIGMTSAI